MIESYLIGKYNGSPLYVNCTFVEGKGIVFNFFNIEKKGKIRKVDIENFSFTLLEDATNIDLAKTIASKCNYLLKYNQRLIIDKNPEMFMINDIKSFFDFKRNYKSSVSYDYCVGLQNNFDKTHKVR